MQARSIDKYATNNESYDAFFEIFHSSNHPGGILMQTTKIGRFAILSRISKVRTIAGISSRLGTSRIPRRLYLAYLGVFYFRRNRAKLSIMILTM